MPENEPRLVDLRRNVVRPHFFRPFLHILSGRASGVPQDTQPRFTQHYICRFTRIASALTPMKATPMRTSEIGQPSESTKCCAVK